MKVLRFILIVSLIQFYNSICICQSTVYIKSGDVGRGILRGRSGECFVIAPHHILQIPNRIEVTTGLEARRVKGEHIHSYVEQDIAIIRLNDTISICNEWNRNNKGRSLPYTKTKGVLQVHLESGGIKYIPVKIDEVDHQFYRISPKNPENDQLSPGMSGSVLFSDGTRRKRILGMLLNIFASDQSGEVYKIENISRLVDSYFPSYSDLTVRSAQEILFNAINLKDGSIQGQKRALEFLIREGHEFKGIDLQGVHLKGADLTNGYFEFGKFNFSNLDNLNGEGILLSGVRLDFASFKNANMVRSDVSNAYGVFVKGINAKFNNANLSSTEFFGSDLRGVNFSSANLNNTVFSFCDLRGAIFDNAQMSQTELIACLLDSAKFIDSKMQNVNINGSVSNRFSFTKEQSATFCRDVNDRRESELRKGNIKLNITIDEKDSSFISIYGSKYKELIKYDNYYSISNGSLNFCTSTKKNSTNPYRTSYSPGYKLLSYESHLIKKSSRKSEMKLWVNDMIDKFNRFLTSERTFKTKEHLEKIKKSISTVTQMIEPNITPSLTSDLMLVLLMRKGIIKQEQVNWKFHSRKYLTIKPDDPGWLKVVPYGTALNEIPNSWCENYKDWTIKRANISLDKFKRKVYSYRSEVDIINIDIDQISDRQRLEWFGNENDTISGKIHKVAYLFGHNNFYYNSNKKYSLLYSHVFLIIPKYISYISINIPGFKNRLNSSNGFKCEVEYQIEDIKLKDGSKHIYLYVTPIGVRYEFKDKESWKLESNVDFYYSENGVNVKRDRVLDWKKSIDKILNGKSLPPHLTPDYSLVLYLSQKLLKPEMVNWKNSTSNYVKSTSSSFLNSKNNWQKFFPEDLKGDKIPKEWVSIYKSWVLKRASLGVKHFYLSTGGTRINRSFEHPESISFKLLDFSYYWKGEYLELFKSQRIDPVNVGYSHSPYVSLNHKVEKRHTIMMYIYPDTRNNFRFNASKLPLNEKLKDISIKVKHDILKVKSFWYKEKQVVLVYCKPSQILYKSINSDWYTVNDFEISKQQ